MILDKSHSFTATGHFVFTTRPNSYSIGGSRLSASDTPGLQSDVAAPIRVWSTRAAKLLVNMFLHRSNDAVDTAATELNEATYNVQMACAKAGTPAVTS